MLPRLLASGLAVGLVLSLDTACEGCDFSFGPISVLVEVTPRSAPATVTICPKDQTCQTLPVGPTEDDPDVKPGTARFPVAWQGYAVCRAPTMTIEVEAPGCETATVSRRRHKHEPDVELVVPVALKCG